MPAGRPRKVLDEEQVYKLASMGCTLAEIAEFFNVSDSTIERNYSHIARSARGSFKLGLRAAQYKRAVRDRSDTMLVHLGKNYLGQSDKSETETTFNIQEGLTDRLHEAIRAYGYQEPSGTGVGGPVSGPLRGSGESGKMEDSSTPGAPES